MELYCQIKFSVSHSVQIAVVSVVKMSFFQAEDWLVSEDAIEVSIYERKTFLAVFWKTLIGIVPH